MMIIIMVIMIMIKMITSNPHRLTSIRSLSTQYTLNTPRTRRGTSFMIYPPEGLLLFVIIVVGIVVDIVLE